MRQRICLLAGAVLLVVLAACGGGKAKPKKAAPPPPTTASTVPQPTVEVSPTSGPIGTKFALAARNFAAGDTLTFEVDFPGGRKFNGQPHTIAADGTVSTTFLVTSQNPPGDYVVKAAATKGQTAEGHFTVVQGAATSTTAKAGTPTTTASTVKPAVTTTTRKP